MIDVADRARALASGAGAVVIDGGADGATITTFVVEGDQRLELDAEALAALREAVPRVLPAPRHNLPAPDPAFRGREEDEAALCGALEARSGSLAVSALRGLGGVGKTELAVRVARAVTPFYPAAQILLDLRGTEPEARTPQWVMENVIARFEAGMKPPDDAAAVREIYRDLPSRNAAILILDNARDTGQVAPLLPPPPSAAIVTSRATLDLPGVVARRLDCLPRAEAVAVLAAHLAVHDPSPAELDALASACGDHPLSLRVAGSWLAQRWELIGIAGYAARIVASRATLRFEGEAGQTEVEAVLGLSLELLLAQDVELAERWRDLAVFPADFDAAAAASVWELGDEDAARDVLIGLSDLGMLEPSSARGRFRLHHLMRDLARSGQPEARFEAPHLRHAAHFLRELAAANDLHLRGGAENALAGLGRFDRERSNIEAGQAWAAAHAPGGGAAAELAMLYPHVGAFVLALRLHSRGQIEWLAAGVVAARELGDRQMEGIALGKLGNAHVDLGDARAAIGYHEHSLAIAREIGDRKVEGNQLGGLGLAHARLGDARAAVRWYEQALAIARETGDRRGEGEGLGNLGNAHLVLGDARAAVGYHERALAIAREIGDRRGEENGLGNLGIASRALGDARAAIGYHEQALAIAREIGDRRGEGNQLGNLGAAHAALGDSRAAIGYHEHSLAITREIGDRMGEGNQLANLGNASAVLGDVQAAIRYYEQSLTISREIGDRRGEGNHLGNLGNVSALLGNVQVAIDYHEQALAIAREIGDRRGEAAGQGNLGSAYSAFGDAHAAISHYAQAVAIFREIGDRRSVGNQFANLAFAYVDVGDLNAAQTCLESALVAGC